MKINLEIELPMYVEVLDYHEFKTIADHFKIITNKISVKEIGFDRGRYVGIIYVNNIDDEENRKFIEETKGTFNDTSKSI